MTLKRRISVYVSIAFSILFGLGISIVYLAFSSFRQAEFTERLQEKALTTVNLLLTVKEIDKQLLKVIDQNSINKLYNEKTLIFDENLNLIYSSIDDASIRWNRQDLLDLKERKKFIKIDNGRDLVGLFYDFEKADYYVLIAAEDKYGNSKLRYLSYILISTFLVGITVMWISTYFIIKKLTKPLDIFQKKIVHISANELNTQLPISQSRNDEITLLTKTFNQMLARIEESFIAQREFTANASHELRTPISRITFQIDNLLQSQQLSETTRNYLHSISNNVTQLSDLINSLLLLAKNSPAEGRHLSEERIDEILFSSYEQVKKSLPDLKMNFEISDSESITNSLVVNAARPVLVIAFANLLRNAYQYSFDKTVSVVINQLNEEKLTVTFSNWGEPLSEQEKGKLFQPFTRGLNSRNTQGSGLGLGIVKRILDYHEATIQYYASPETLHHFEIIFTI